MKRKRAWWIIGVFVLLCGLLFFISLSRGEHPDYRRGAEGLVAARERARQTFGTLTWEEHRKENGYEEAQDEMEWLALEESIPVSFETYRNRKAGLPPEWTVEELYFMNREWLFSLADEIEPLRLTRASSATAMDSRDRADDEACQQVGRQLTFLLMGAADAGDADGVREVGKVAWMLVERLLEEIDISSSMHSDSISHSMSMGIVSLAVSNRHNPEIIDAFKDVMATRPAISAYAEIIAGQIRTDASVPKKSIQSLIGDELASQRRVGKNTANALEARYWETTVDIYEMCLDLAYSSGDAQKKIAELKVFLGSRTDRSFELAERFMLTVSAGSMGNGDFVRNDITAIALELLARYPEYADLPDSLPADLAWPDPFGGEALLYFKTPYGFVVYSRYENRIDDGFPIDPGMLEGPIMFSQRQQELDLGCNIVYKTKIPRP